jgi:hypothetical protein
MYTPKKQKSVWFSPRPCPHKDAPLLAAMFRTACQDVENQSLVGDVGELKAKCQQLIVFGHHVVKPTTDPRFLQTRGQGSWA